MEDLLNTDLTGYDPNNLPLCFPSDEKEQKSTKKTKRQWKRNLKRMVNEYVSSFVPQESRKKQRTKRQIEPMMKPLPHDAMLPMGATCAEVSRMILIMNQQDEQTTRKEIVQIVQDPTYAEQGDENGKAPKPKPKRTKKTLVNLSHTVVKRRHDHFCERLTIEFGVEDVDQWIQIDVFREVTAKNCRKKLWTKCRALIKQQNLATNGYLKRLGAFFETFDLDG